MGFLRRTQDDAAADPGAPRAAPAGLAEEHRARIDAELTARGIGDALERRMFLAALDYQVSALAERLPRHGRSGLAETGLAARACSAAADGLGATAGDEAQRLCRGFVAELARTFDACFETPPTDEANGPFHGVVKSLRESTGLMLTCDRQLIEQATGTLGPGTP